MRHASCVTRHASFVNGISWEGISWQGICWEGISWEGIGWEGIRWEGIGCVTRHASRVTRHASRVMGHGGGGLTQNSYIPPGGFVAD